MSSYFSADLKKMIEGYLVRFETPRSGILPILHAIQDEKDWISPEDITALEKEFKLSIVDVEEVLSFYSMYRTSPPKPFRLEVCNSISCWLMGSHKTIEHIQKKLEENPEIPFSCKEVECLGYCGYAPVALVNKDRHSHVTPEKALELIQQYTQNTKDKG